MIRPEHEGRPGTGSAPTSQDEPGAQDFWAYVQDERQRYPHLWRAIVRVHTRAFELAYPGFVVRDAWKMGDVILRDVVAAIENVDQSQSADTAGSNRFRLQMPIFPTERLTPNFEGTWRGWLTIGRPERVY